MDDKLVQMLLQNGYSPRQIARDYHYSRLEVETFARELSSHRRASRRKRTWMILLPLFLIGILAYCTSQWRRDPPEMEVHRNVVKLAEAMPTQGKDHNSWFIQHEQGPRTSAEFAAEIELIRQLTARLNKSLADNSDIPEVAEIKKEFGDKLVPTIFQGGITRYVGAEGEAEKAFKPGFLEVVFFGRASFDHPIINHHLLQYAPGMGALMIAALKFEDEKWYDAMIAHEAWHARMHRAGSASATARTLSDSWIGEELMAHGIEKKVLNARTNGDYQRRLETIVSRTGGRTFRQLLLRLTPTDLQYLDTLFAPGIPEETDIRSAQYLLDLSLLWTQKHYTGEELPQRSMEAYRFLIQPQSTNVR